MCDYAPFREAAMTITHRDDDGKPIVWCDPCIAPIVKALNDGGMQTVASCCGHGRQAARISLRNGTDLWVLPFERGSDALAAFGSEVPR